MLNIPWGLGKIKWRALSFYPMDPLQKMVRDKIYWCKCLKLNIWNVQQQYFIFFFFPYKRETLNKLKCDHPCFNVRTYTTQYNIVTNISWVLNTICKKYLLSQLYYELHSSNNIKNLFWIHLPFNIWPTFGSIIQHWMLVDTSGLIYCAKSMTITND